MMLHFRLLLLISIVSWPKNSVVAFPHLRPRQFDNVFNFDWEKAGAGLFTGLGAMGTFLMNNGNDQQDETTTTTPKEKTMPGPAPPGPLLSEPDYELGNQPPQLKAPPWVPSAPPPPCEMTNILSNDCGKVLDQLIFTTGCKTMAKGQVPTATAIVQNTAILAALNRMAPGRVRASKSNHCGIFMFMAPLTSDQSRQIEMLPGVSQVRSNIFFDAGSSSLMDSQPQPGEIEPAFKRRQLRKRDIVRQQNAPSHLPFISTSENFRGITTDYIYDSSSGADTVVFWIGPGMIMNHDDFTNNPVTHDDFIFSDDIPEDSTYLPTSFGTCVASLVMGKTFGVSKRTKMKPVRIDAHVGSLIFAMIKIANYVSTRLTDSSQQTNGFVMLMDMEWQNTVPRTTQSFETVFELLLYDYDVITVVSSGTDTSSSNGPINSYPAYYAADTPVISVGAVDLSGAALSWSRGGGTGLVVTAPGMVTALTVTAPGMVVCASEAGGRGASGLVTGSAMAPAQAAGLAAYFLTRYPELRAEQNLMGGAALAVKNFMVEHAWARLPGGDISIWNLMGPDVQNPSGDGIGANSPY